MPGEYYVIDYINIISYSSFTGGLYISFPGGSDQDWVLAGMLMCISRDLI